MSRRRWLLATLWLGGCDTVFGLERGDADVAQPVTYIQSSSAGAAQVSKLALSLAAKPLQPGDLIAVAVGTYNGDAFTLADSAGNVYRRTGGATNTTVSSLSVLYAVNVVASEDLIVTATVDNAQSDSEISMAAHVYRGAHSEPFEVRAVGAGVSSMPESSAISLTTVEDRVLFAALVHEESNTVSSPGPRFTRREGVNETIGVQLTTEDSIGSELPPAATFGLTAKTSWACEGSVFH